MFNNTNTNKMTWLFLAIGLVLGAFLVSLLNESNLSYSENNTSTDKSEPLYWVAPMDANYRRDKPGKSPMGMDLVPVYDDASAGGDINLGVVTIPPHIVNNLGVKVVSAEMGSINKVISTVGYVKYNQDNLIHIHPRVSGWIEELFVKAEGDPVSKGQALYTLYSPELVNAQEEFLIALKRNNTALIKAAKERLSALQISADLLKTLEQSKQVKQTITFYATQSGVLDGLKIREGFYVKPGNTLMSIGQLNQVWVEAEVFERDAGFIKQGATVSMSLDYLPGKAWQGEVDYIYPSLNAQNRTLRVRLRFENPDLQLRPNMYAQLDIDASEHRESLLVPLQSVIRTGKQDRVVVALGDGQFKSVQVKVGAIENERAEIVEGINLNDKVVVSAQFLIDSESSKTSDFMRMAPQTVVNSAWLSGQVNKVNIDDKVVNITHEPSDALGWPEMTMDFSVADSVELELLQADQTLHFEVTKTEESDYLLTGIHIMSQPKVSSATVTGVINHIDIDTRVLNISRQAIEKWGRPAATLDFTVSNDIEVSELKVGQSIVFTFEVHDEFVIVKLNPDMNLDTNTHSSHH